MGVSYSLVWEFASESPTFQTAPQQILEKLVTEKTASYQETYLVAEAVRQLVSNFSIL